MRNRKNMLAGALLLLACVLPYGCASVNWLGVESHPPRPTIHLKAGLYISPYIKGYDYGGPADAHIGNCLSAGMKEVCGYAFDEVVIIDSPDSAVIPQRGIQVIIEPEVVRTFLLSDNHSWGVTCKWTITDVNGKVLYMNMFTGEGHGGFGGWRWGHNMELAVKDSCQKFLTHVTSVDWWKDVK